MQSGNKPPIIETEKDKHRPKSPKGYQWKLRRTWEQEILQEPSEQDKKCYEQLSNRRIRIEKELDRVIDRYDKTLYEMQRMRRRFPGQFRLPGLRHTRRIRWVITRNNMTEILVNSMNASWNRYDGSAFMPIDALGHLAIKTYDSYERALHRCLFGEKLNETIKTTGCGIKIVPIIEDLRLDPEQMDLKYGKDWGGDVYWEDLEKMKAYNYTPEDF